MYDRGESWVGQKAYDQGKDQISKKPSGNAEVFALHFEGNGGGHRRLLSKYKIKEFRVFIRMFTSGK